MENGPTMEMPKYRSHKEVWALKIEGIGPQDEAGNALIYPAEKGYAPFEVDSHYLLAHNPVVGGYYVCCRDGYRSFSPTEAFEECYTRI